MKNKTAIITLRVVLSEMPKDMRKRYAKDAECSVKNLPCLADINIGDLADAIVGRLPDDEELFAGTDLFAVLDSAVVVSSGWLDPAS